MPATRSYKFIKGAEAASQLGCSDRKLRQYAKEGYFKLGLHYRNTSSPGNQRPRYLFNVAAIAELFDTPRVKWKKYR